MKVIWEIEDIRAGIEFGKPGVGERSVIGYIGDLSTPATISHSDNAVNVYGSKAELVNALNTFCYMPACLIDAGFK